MSLFSKNDKTPGTLGAASTSLQNELKSGAINVAVQTAELTTSMEGITDAGQRQMLMNAGSDAQDALKDVLAKLNISTEDLAEHQLEAGAFGLIGGAAAAKYHQAATNTNVSMEAGVEVIAPVGNGSYGSTDYVSANDTNQISMEAFQNVDLSVVQAHSAVWNIGASRQDSASELWYPTHVLSPDHTALDVKLPRTLIYKGMPRSFNGDPADFGFKNVLEAFRDHTLLENEVTQVLPYVLEDGSNAKHFVDPALVAVQDRPMAGSKADFKVAPFKIGAKFDLLSISNNPAVLDGATNETDQLHSKIVLDKIYIKATADGKTSVIPFKVSDFTRAAFTKTVEGDFVEMQLTFGTEDLGIDGHSKDVSNVEAEAFAALKTAGYAGRLQVEVSGKVNLQTGLTSLFASIPDLVALTKDGESISITSGAGKAIKDGLALELIGYDLQAWRTNANLRSRSLLIDRNWKVDRFTIPLAAPISVIAPLGMDDGDAQAMNDLINTTNIRNSNMALTTNLNYMEALKNFCAQNADVVSGKRQSLSLTGIARYLITPHYAEIELDIEKELLSLNSSARIDDINAVLCNAIRVMAYDAVVASNYLPALRQFTQGSDEKPNLLIMTDLNLPQYLMTQGDPRTVGIGMSHQIESTPDLRMKDTILMTFGRTGRNGPDYMSYGTHLWIPELVSVAQVFYKGANVRTLQVQPRNTWIHQLPIGMKITVKNLQKAISKLVAYKVENTVVAP